MKKIYVYLAAIMLFMAWSCDDNENMAPVGNWQLSEPVISTPTDNASIVIDNTESTTFEWQPASTTNKFVIQYKVVLVPKGSTDYGNAILTLTPGNNGRETSVTASAAQIDYALWANCYDAGETVQLDWIVMAQAIEKQTIATHSLTVTRSATEYLPQQLFLTGDATEGGSDLASAIPMRAKLDADGNQTGVFEAYTHLEEGSTYFFRDQANELSRKMGGSNGTLSCGTTIDAPASGEYRITVDLVNNTYSLFKIDRWSLVGDAVEGGWGGDVPMNYVGNGIWELETMFFQPYDGATWILRANGDWGYLLKRVKGTATPNKKGGNVVMESEAASQGVEVEDMSGTTGLHKVVLDLSAGAYNYSLTKIQVPVETIFGKTTSPDADQVSGTFPIQADETPAELYLLEDGELLATFTKDGSIFSTGNFIALQAAKQYSLNSAADGSGIAYDGDEDGIITVDHDQAYQIKVDFSKKEVAWKHYNLKLFHWDELGGGWDARQELLMTYTHPYHFEVTGDLNAGFASKFNSPWEVQFGTSATALSGTMTNGGDNYYGIVSTGTYKATIDVSPDFQTGDYSFVKQ